MALSEYARFHFTNVFVLNESPYLALGEWCDPALITETMFAVEDGLLVHDAEESAAETDKCGVPVSCYALTNSGRTLLGMEPA